MTKLVKPVITEKSMADAARGVFTFQVVRTASKAQVAMEVAKLFGVTVVSVNTRMIKQAAVRTGRRRLLSTVPPVKYALLKLKQGESISLFDLKEE